MKWVHLDTVPGFTPSPPWNGGEGRGEEVRGCLWLGSNAPLPGPLPARASQGEGVQTLLFLRPSRVHLDTLLGFYSLPSPLRGERVRVRGAHVSVERGGSSNVRV